MFLKGLVCFVIITQGPHALHILQLFATQTIEAGLEHLERGMFMAF